MQDGSRYVPPHLRGGGGEAGPGPVVVQSAGGVPEGPVPVQGSAPTGAWAPRPGAGGGGGGRGYQGGG
ncbi:unnamed protein product, partial [Pylaiella littoralis]